MIGERIINRVMVGQSITFPFRQHARVVNSGGFSIDNVKHLPNARTPVE
jgi:hypothetical protein